MDEHSLPLVCQDFLSLIASENIFQAKFLHKSISDMSGEDAVKLEHLMKYYQTQGYTIKSMVDKYLRYTDYLKEEQFYFIKHKKYRCSTLSDAMRYYNDPIYMECNVIGLSLSTYLWKPHRTVMRFFQKFLDLSKTAKTYFEIGPNHGEYMVTAMKEADFQQYTAIDISKSAVDMTKRYIKYSMPNCPKKHDVIHGDFLDYHNGEGYDAVVMGEVLVHVEKPLLFLDKARKLTLDSSLLFLTTVINAPSPVEIIMFNSLQEVQTMIQKANFQIIDKIAVNHQNVSLEIAEEKKLPMVVGFILSPNKTAAGSVDL